MAVAPRWTEQYGVVAVVTEAERRGRRRRLVVIIGVAVLILAGFLLFGRLRRSALDDKSDAAITQLRPAWRHVDLAKLRDAYDQAAVRASASGDYSRTIELFPKSGDASFVSADLSTAGAIAARYSIETWAGSQCLDVLARAPAPNRVTFTTRKGC
jgi:hypothetical protein